MPRWEADGEDGRRWPCGSRSVRLLSLGTGAVEPVPADGQGRMRPDVLAQRLAAGGGPAIVCAQVDNVNSGAVDPVGEI